jgi:hypothetical protein
MMRAPYLLAPILLTLLSSCSFESGPGGDGLTGNYYLQRVNDQAVPRWPLTLRVESSDGPMEITTPSSIELKPGGTFLQELTILERPTSNTVRTHTRSGSGTYRRLDESTIEFSGGLTEGMFIGTLSPGTGTAERILAIDRRGDDGLTYTYVLLKDLHFR